MNKALPEARRWAVLGTVLLIAGAGCASIAHPERVDQPKEQRGKLDIPMAALDLAIPGGSLLLIHDLMNGTVYYPKTDGQPKSSTTNAP